MKNLLIILFSIFNVLLCYRGDLVSFEYKDSKSLEDIQQQLNNTFGESLSPEALFDIHMYSIVYETIDQFGNTTIASGLIAYPDDISLAYPILTFQHGTQIRRESAPSIRGFNDLVLWLATSGYIYIEPDYLGLGISEILHPYHLKDVTASSVIDMIRASKHFCDQLSEIQYNNQLFLAGYSEGGYATMAAVKEIEDNLSEEFDITVSFPMAGAYDLSGTMVDLMLLEESYPDPFYLPFFVLSYIEKYQLGEIGDFFLPEYASIFPDLFSGEYSGGYIDSFLPDIPIHMMLPSVIEEFTENENYPFRVHLGENDLYDWIPENTMYIFHGVADESVPHDNSVVAYNRFIENGAENVYFESLPESYGGHQEAAPYCLFIAFDISETLKVMNIKSDINIDGFTDILDVVLMVSIIMDPIQNISSFESWASDLNSDSIINILDVIATVNLIIQF
ncbi:MAG: hypothetical protein CMG66_06225 [Candidatus Marinimicrobia bacterium]|nr:hypothetical protein [Candidatus Neomarinimicrobiota bacterium]|tara:strand:+ start:31229 stop:32578 length:1350 start_codon:yes stop_codon:yes gene_type:complete